MTEHTNEDLEARIAELEAACQRLRDDYQGALAEVQGLKRDVAGQTRSAQNGWRTADAMRAGMKAAEADAAGLRARIEAFVAENDGMERAGASLVGRRWVTNRLRALASVPEPNRKRVAVGCQDALCAGTFPCPRTDCTAATGKETNR